MAGMRNGLRRLAADRKEWAGIPLPLDGSPLVIEPSYPHADAIMGIGRPDDPPEPEAGIVQRNVFWSWHRRSDVVVWERDGKIEWGMLRTGMPAATMALATLGAADAWGVEQEGAAVDLLGGLLRHRQFKQYLMTGMFLERSRRSGLSYLFRRLRPTLVLSTRREPVRILCALCLHPIGYYAGSWAGAMTPTDEVVAHLTLMRGDEPMFWRRSNQHPPWRPEAGV